MVGVGGGGDGGPPERIAISAQLKNSCRRRRIHRNNRKVIRRKG